MHMAMRGAGAFFFRRLALRGLVVLGLLLTAAVGSASPSTADVGIFPGGTSVKIARDSQTQAIFPIELRKGIKLAQVKVRIVDVRQNDIPAQDLRNAVVKVGFKKKLPAVELTFEDPKPEVGTYDVTVQLSQGKNTQLVSFVLVRDSADIKALGSLSVVEEEPWGFLNQLDWFGDLSKLGPTSTPTLMLRVGPHEEIGAGDITVTETDSEQGTVTGALKKVADGFEYDYKLDEMPLGPSEQTLEFSSPQLESPVVVTLNVTHRRPMALIGLVVLFGLVAGAGVRRWIEPTIVRYEARLGLLALIQRILEIRAGTADPTLIAKLDQALAVARSVPRYATAQTILAKTKQVEDLLAAALAPQPPAATKGAGIGGIRKTVVWVMETTEPVRLWLIVRVLSWARAVLLSMFLVLAAYALYAETWTGSWQQLVTVASWAFALDITTESVTRQFVKPAAAGELPQPVTTS